jgi:hypothetical protein
MKATQAVIMYFRMLRMLWLCSSMLTPPDQVKSAGSRVINKPVSQSSATTDD